MLETCPLLLDRSTKNLDLLANIAWNISFSVRCTFVSVWFDTLWIILFWCVSAGAIWIFAPKYQNEWSQLKCQPNHRLLHAYQSNVFEFLKHLQSVGHTHGARETWLLRFNTNNIFFQTAISLLSHSDVATWLRTLRPHRRLCGEHMRSIFAGTPMYGCVSATTKFMRFFFVRCVWLAVFGTVPRAIFPAKPNSPFNQKHHERALMHGPIK